jgi:cobalt-zinc-cadmium efflux system membrane fusion protein
MKWIAIVLVLTACSKSEPAPEASSPRDTPEARVVRVDAKLIESGRIATVKSEARPVRDVLVATGQVEAPPDARAEVASPISARVKSMSVRRGDIVKKGDVLAVLEAGEVARVASDLARARARRTHAERVLAQEQKLLAENATSERAVSDAQSAVSTARADETAARTLLSSYGASRGTHLVLKAPIGGSVVMVDGAVGAPVEATTPMFVIVDTTRLEVRADVAEADASAVRDGVQASLTPATGGTTCTGAVGSHAPSVNPSTRTVPFRIVPGEGCAGLIEGSFVDVAIERGGAGGNKLVSVPRDAVVSVDGVPTVFVAEGPAFRAHSVRVARYAGARVYLEDGVLPNASVVVRGALLLKGELLRSELE